MGGKKEMEEEKERRGERRRKLNDIREAKRGGEQETEGGVDPAGEKRGKGVTVNQTGIK